MWKKKAPVTIAGVIAIGVICSALYDIFVKPGMNQFSRFIVKVFTFGSQRVKDHSFLNAALDPTSLPALLLLLIVISVVINVIFVRTYRIYFGKREQRNKEASPRKKALVKWFLFPINLVFVLVFIFVYFNIFNQAVVTWRVFHANIAIIEPYISSTEVLKIKARYSSMTTEAEYDQLHLEMREIAKKNNTQLRSEEPW